MVLTLLGHARIPVNGDHPVREAAGVPKRHGAAP